MKKPFGRYFILILLLSALIGCQNPLEQAGQESSLGTGSFSLVLDTAYTERSVVPGTNLNSFAVFTLQFFTSGTANLIYNEDRLPAALSKAISLPGGTLDLSVTAYTDPAKTKPAAWGNLSGIVINEGATTTGTVTLAAVNDAGSGTFAWNITYPANVTFGKMSFIRIEGSTETSAGTHYFAGGKPQVGKTGSLSLNSGYYRVVFHLHSNDGKIAERSEILHIYRNLESSFSATFNANDFHFDRVKQVSFEGGATTAVVDFCNLSNNTIYLVKVNSGNLVAYAVDTGGAVTQSPMLDNVLLPNQAPGKELPRMGHPAADEIAANPPPFVAGPTRKQASSTATVNDTRDFWVETYFNSGVFIQRQATLRAQGTYGNIWVMDTNFNSGGLTGANLITTQQAEAFAKKFDIIYPAETKILGYEYGGGPGGDGGKDGDLRIQILIYDIVDNSGNVMASGFFWGKDFYPSGSETKSNLAEIFYLDASQMNGYPDYMYSTLAHEFQHMIHFNQKVVKNGVGSEAWYNEMLSMMTEDVMSDIIGISPTNWQHSIQQRIPYFLPSYYKLGVTEWGLTEWNNNPDEYIRNSYATKYAFGAYLLRNFGGTELLSKILANSSSGIPSISAALDEMVKGMDFDKALKRYGETLIFTGQDGYMTFNKTVTNVIDGYTFKAHAFNVWTDFKNNEPYVFPLTQSDMRPYSIFLHSDNTWKNKTGDFSITVQRPTSSNVTLYLMAR